MKIFLMKVLLFLAFLFCNLLVLGQTQLVIKIKHSMGGEPVEMGGKQYETAAGDLFSVNDIKYYISNIKLRNSRTGKFYIEPESYHLVTVTSEEPGFEIILSEVPGEKFTQLEFAIGVDNGKNTSTDHVGDLDPAHEMAWNWKTGYKFFTLVGNLYPKDSEAKEGLVVHIGFNENYRIVTLNLNNSENGNANGQQKVINLDADLLNIFNEPNKIELQDNQTIMIGEIASKIADNYQQSVFKISTEQ